MFDAPPVNPIGSDPSACGGKDDSFAVFVTALRGGCTDAIERLVDDFGPGALRTIRNHLGADIRKRMDSQDLLQDVWLTILRHLDDLPQAVDHQNLGRYIYRIAYHQVTEQARRCVSAQKRSVKREKPLDESLAAEQSISQAAVELQDWLDHLLARLSDRDKTIVGLKMEGLNNCEIASRLDVDEGTVRRSLRRLCRIAT